MKSLKLMLLSAGYPEKDMFSHESDLYVFRTDLTTRIIYQWIRDNGYKKELRPVLFPVFTDNITGRPMYDLAFMNF